MKKSSVAVLGLGAFGSTIAKTLIAFDHHVIGIDVSESRVNAIAEKLEHAVIADAKNVEALRDAGVDRCDIAVIAIGENLEANIVAAMNARLFNVDEIWVKAHSDVHRRILRKIGVTHVVNPEEEIGNRVAQKIHNPYVSDYMSVGKSQTAVTITVPDNLVGKSLREVELADNSDIVCLGVVRNATHQAAEPDLVLEEADTLMLFGKRKRLLNFGERYCI